VRKPIRFRLLYLLIAISTYTAGFLLLPDTTKSSRDTFISGAFLLAYFVLLPALFWYCVIKVGQQKRWKIIIPLSVACVVARYSMPPSLAAYFEFLSWARYPIIAILLIVELAVIYHVISMLWKSRKISGDPRVNTLINNVDNDDKKRELAFMMASEPASWYYAIPRFSKKHIPAISNLSLRSASRWHITLVVISLFTVTTISYTLLMQWSELAAIIVSTLIGYGIISLIASHRISRHYSIYIHDNHLVVNATFYNLLLAPLSQIKACETGVWQCDKEQVKIGRGTRANIKLTFSKPVLWFTMMGMFNEQLEEVFLCVDNPNALAASLYKCEASNEE
jgi:hypothetical protein